MPVSRLSDSTNYIVIKFEHVGRQEGPFTVMSKLTPLNIFGRKGLYSEVQPEQVRTCRGEGAGALYSGWGQGPLWWDPLPEQTYRQVHMTENITLATPLVSNNENLYIIDTV